MADEALTCPNCGSQQIVNIQLPRHSGDHSVHTTQAAHRCKDCATQWTDRDQWLADHDDSRPTPESPI